MKILLAVDASEPSQYAIGEVLARSWPARSTVDVITVVEPVHLWTMSETAEELHRRATAVLQTTLEQLREAGLEADGDILQGDPKQVILARAAETYASCIVVGSHKVSAAAHILLGNVAANVLRHAECPVIIARSHTAAASGLKVLVATDGSVYSLGAVRSIASRPWPKSTHVRVLSVVEPVFPAMQALFEPPFIESKEIEDARGVAMQHAQRAVAEAMQILQPVFPDASEAISVLLGQPHTLILQEAKEWGADLIVLGSHGRQGAERFLLGSVSEGVATHAGCSVEVIH